MEETCILSVYCHQHPLFVWALKKNMSRHGWGDCYSCACACMKLLPFMCKALIPLILTWFIMNSCHPVQTTNTACMCSYLSVQSLLCQVDVKYWDIYINKDFQISNLISQAIFCRHCHQPYHPGNCSQVTTQLHQSESSYRVDSSRAERARWERLQSEETIQATTKPCPKCKTPTEKNGKFRNWIILLQRVSKTL